MNGNIFVVYTYKSKELGLCAMAQKVPACNNLASFCKDYGVETLNVVSTWKRASEIAKDWNESFRNNGRQIGGDIDHIMLVENHETNQSTCHIFYVNGTKRKEYNYTPFEAVYFMRDYEAPTDERVLNGAFRGAIKLYGKTFDKEV